MAEPTSPLCPAMYILLSLLSVINMLFFYKMIYCLLISFITIWFHFVRSLSTNHPHLLK